MPKNGLMAKYGKKRTRAESDSSSDGENGDARPAARISHKAAGGSRAPEDELDDPPPRRAASDFASPPKRSKVGQAARKLTNHVPTRLDDEYNAAEEEVCSCAHFDDTNLQDATTAASRRAAASMMDRSDEATPAQVDAMLDAFRNAQSAIEKKKLNRTTAAQLSHKLFDQMKQMVATQPISSAGVHVDSSARVFSVNVDSLFTDCSRAVVSLGLKMKNKSGANDGEEEGDEASAAAAVRRRDQQRRQRQNRGFIELDHTKLNVQTTVADVNYQEDALFRRVCQSFDEGGLSGILMNQVRFAFACM